jgi:hypothetical protein
MILEANAGVETFRKEGRQAANNADSAVGELKFLRRLLLIHGRTGAMCGRVVTMSAACTLAGNSV